jgi:signal transduction histidine kinase
MTGSIPPADREAVVIGAPPDSAAAEQQCRFAADAAHELCTPVAALRVELEEARLHPEETDLSELLDRALGNVDRLQTIVTDLLTLARAQSAAPIDRQRVDLAELVHVEVSRHGDRYETSVLPVAEGDPGVVVDADRFQLRRVLAILLDNAYRHARSSIRVQVRLDGEAAELSVTDDGQGVAVADRERIFQPFARLDAARDRRHGGAGLGLSIAREIIRSHGGTLGVDGSAAGGARFVVRLPAAGPPRADQRSRRREEARLEARLEQRFSALPEGGPGHGLERRFEDLLVLKARNRRGYRCAAAVRHAHPAGQARLWYR